MGANCTVIQGSMSRRCLTHWSRFERCWSEFACTMLSKIFKMYVQLKAVKALLNTKHFFLLRTEPHEDTC